jgi:hypothetical protein
VERPDGVYVEFAYDPFARRVSKRVMRRIPQARWCVGSATSTMPTKPASTAI